MVEFFIYVAEHIPFTKNAKKKNSFGEVNFSENPYILRIKKARKNIKNHKTFVERLTCESIFSQRSYLTLFFWIRIVLNYTSPKLPPSPLQNNLRLRF